MFNLIIAPILALVMAIGGCSSTSPVVVNGIPVTDVQSALKAACGFELLAGSAAAEIQLLIGVIPGVSTATSIAAAVCAAVNQMPTGARAMVGANMNVVVKNVLVHGRRVR